MCVAEIELIKGADNGNPPDKLPEAYPKVNRNFKRLNDRMEGHISGPRAHDAQNIAYDGDVSDADDVAEALDELKRTMDQLIVDGDSSPEAAAARYSSPYNKTYPTLKDRLDAADNRILNFPLFMISDYANIQAAIDVCAGKGGGTVLIPAGMYTVPPLVLKTGVTLQGSGIGVTVLTLSAGSNTAFVTAATSTKNVTLTGISFDANKSAQTASADALKLVGTNNVIVDTCQFYNALGHGVSLDACNGFTIRSSQIYSNESNGLIYRDTKSLRIADNHIYNNKQRGVSSYGETEFGSEMVTIERNRIRANTLDGIRIEYTSTKKSNTRDVTITQNRVADNLSHGIVVRSESSMITENRVTGNGLIESEQGICVQAADTTVADNLIAYSSGVGIDLGNATRAIVDANRVLFCGLLGIEINSTPEATVTNNIVLYNNRINYNITITGGIMIHLGSPFPEVDGESYSVMVSGNRVGSGTYQKYGIYVSDGSYDVSIVGNHCKGSGSSSDIFSASSSVLIENNMTSVSSQSGVIFASAYDLRIPIHANIFKVNGTTTINTIKFEGNVMPVGKRIVLIFQQIMLVNDKSQANGNVDLQGAVALQTTINTTLELVSDGTNWLEMSRNVK